MKKNLSFSLSLLLVLSLLTGFFFAGWSVGARVTRSKNVAAIDSTPIPLRDPALLTFYDNVQFSGGDFKDQIGTYIDQGKYSCALKLLMLASPDEIIEATEGTLWYCAIDCDVNVSIGDRITLPGSKREYDLARDWIIPDSGYGSESRLWDRYSRVFAERFNRTVADKNKEKNNVSEKTKLTQ